MTKRPIVHIEIPALDHNAAANFYFEMFGWSFTRLDEPEPYIMFETGNTGGGFTPYDEAHRPGEILIYIASDDIDADLAKARNLGATVVQEKMEIIGVGWFAWLEDPSGNRIALWTAAKT